MTILTEITLHKYREAQNGGIFIPIGQMACTSHHVSFHCIKADLFYYKENILLWAEDPFLRSELCYTASSVATTQR